MQGFNNGTNPNVCNSFPSLRATCIRIDAGVTLSTRSVLTLDAIFFQTSACMPTISKPIKNKYSHLFPYVFISSVNNGTYINILLYIRNIIFFIKLQFLF